MIICSCNVISDHDIKRVIDQLKAENPRLIVTPDLIFKSLERRSKCGTCITSFLKLIKQGSVG